MKPPTLAPPGCLRNMHRGRPWFQGAALGLGPPFRGSVVPTVVCLTMRNN